MIGCLLGEPTRRRSALLVTAPAAPFRRAPPHSDLLVVYSNFGTDRF